jgi:hypothetical protein
MSGGVGQAALGRLLVIDVVAAHGIAIVQTIWAVTPELRAGRRVTRAERFADPHTLRQRLAELVPLILADEDLPAAAPKKAAA